MNKSKNFFRNCPNPDNNFNCKNRIGHISEKGMIYADQNKRKCSSCKMFKNDKVIQSKNVLNKLYLRKCPNVNGNPNCLLLLSYISENNMWVAEEMGILCTSCTQKRNGNTKGENNPFYGKTHNEETRNRMSVLKKKCIVDGRFGFGTNGGICGVHISSELPFYSSCELNFILNYEDRKNLVRADVGIERMPIPYGDTTYLPDFKSKDKVPNVIYEIKETGVKVKKKWKTIKEKLVCAVNWCKDQSMIIKLVEMPTLSKTRVVFPLCRSGVISLRGKWKKQYDEWLKNQPPEVMLSQTTKKVIQMSGVPNEKA
ncbi:hypothetical protein C4577_03645 [Candidatus Parcubacteria bacterium]|nr:MAG: hypothetical protein C4577_03645 [Candidatus Parcubacteria bacterium]